MSRSKPCRVWANWLSLLLVLIVVRVVLGPGLGGLATGWIVSVGIGVHSLSSLVRRWFFSSHLPHELLDSEGSEDEDDQDYESFDRQIGMHDSEQENEDPASIFSQPRRLFFLDNLKTALTFIVVSHHVTCAFGGCDRAWVLVVGLYENPFSPVASSIVILDQGYFMSLFFFISAYFTPSSYDRKGKEEFMFEKSKRLGIPLILMTVLIFPFIILYCEWFTRAVQTFSFAPGHCWFLVWLLLLDVAYSHVRESYSTDQPGEPSAVDFPSTKMLSLYGLVVCGLGMFVVIMIIPGSFATMPISIGSLVNDLFMFAAGIAAQRNGWLEKPLREQLGISIFALRLAVLVSAVMMCGFIIQFLETMTLWFGFAGVLVSGVYCIGMSLVMIDLFQTFLDFQTTLSQGLAEAAYTVYLIHPVAVVGFTSLWVYCYESMGYGEIDFEGNLYSRTPVAGDGWMLAVSWFLVNLACHCLLWPLAWGIRRLPVLREIL